MSEENKDENLQQSEQQQAEKPQSEQIQAESKSDSETSLNDSTVKKIIYSLCYLWGILFFLPLLLYKDDAEAKMHANEGLLLLIFAVVGNVVFGVLSSFLGWVFGMIAGIYSLLLFVLGLIGIIYIVTDKKETLPLIGSIKLIK